MNRDIIYEYDLNHIQKNNIRILRFIFVLFILLIICFNTAHPNTHTDIWNDRQISFLNKHKRDDNPWNSSTGIIEYEGEECVFFTPETGFVLSNKKSDHPISLQVMLHSSVSKVSDGAYIDMVVYDDSEKVLEEKSIYINNCSQWSDIPLNYNTDFSKVSFTCNSNGRGNDNGDWIVIRNHYVFPSNFGREEYIRSVTYFGNEWPLNFWNSEFEDIDNDFKQIINDGFNSIILVIPWKEFQTSIDPITYCEYAFVNLEKIVKKANEYNLDVFTRIGYLWDYYNDSNEYIIDRYLDILQNEKTYAAWLDYCKTLYNLLSLQNNFKDAFIAWEDFWDYTKICNIENVETRTRYADSIGYQEWVMDNFSLKEYNKISNSKYSSYKHIPIPQRDEPGMSIFYDFFDESMNKLLVDTQEVFPNISMEVRLDSDIVNDKEGNAYYYPHTNQYMCGNSDFTCVMYGIPMGFENKGEKVIAKQALKQSESILSSISKYNEYKPIYIEQFLFCDNTPKFSHNAQIIDEDINEYLQNIASILKKYSRGYGLWVYKNYRNNMIYNSQFALESKGWNVVGQPEFVRFSDSNVCCISSGDSIYQTIPKTRDVFPSDIYHFSFNVLKNVHDSNICIHLGNTKKNILINKPGKYTIDFELQNGLDFRLELVSGEAIIDNLCLYSFVQNGQVYDENNNKLECADTIRELNLSLSN